MKNKFFNILVILSFMLLGANSISCSQLQKISPSDKSSKTEIRPLPGTGAGVRTISSTAVPEISEHNTQTQAKNAKYYEPPRSISNRPRLDIPNMVMLQGFHWTSTKTKPWWGIVAGKAGEIGRAGFNMVWLPPSGHAASDEGYLPGRYYDQESRYGTQKQLQQAVDSLHRAGVGAMADIVVNHRVGSTDWADFTEPQWGPESICSDDEWPGAKGERDTGYGFHAGRDLDHTKKFVRDDIVDWLNWMYSYIGYDAWRFDYSKGYSAKYAGEYVTRSKNTFSVGEFWDDLSPSDTNAHRQRLCDWLDEARANVSLFDFTTKGILQLAVATRAYYKLRDHDGKPSGLIGWWPERAVTFIDNHDTGPSMGGGQNHWPFPSDEIMQGYTYILTHPGIPCIYWVHYFDWGLKEEINKLIQVRKRNKINYKSPVKIIIADKNQYVAEVGGSIIMKIGFDYSWSPNMQQWKLATSGKNYAVWERK